MGKFNSDTRFQRNASTDAKEKVPEDDAYEHLYFRFHFFLAHSYAWLFRTWQRSVQPSADDRIFSFDFRTCGRTSVRSRAHSASEILQLDAEPALKVINRAMKEA